MKFLVGFLLFLLVPELALASGQNSGRMERLRIGAFYGYGSLPAADLNNYINSSGANTSPHWGNLTSTWQYGGSLGYMLTPRVELLTEYDQEWASNPVNETSPSTINNAGVQINMNAAWAGLNFWFYEHSGLRLALGGLGGYPTYAHATVINGPFAQYDAQPAPIGQAIGTAEVMLGNRFSLNIEGGYQYALLGALSQGGGTTSNLKQANGSNVNLDFSGWKIKAGLWLHF